MTHFNLQLTTEVYATPDEVFAAFTDKDYFEAWSKSEGFIEQKIGGRLFYFNGEITGTVKEIDPGYSFAASWMPGHWQNIYPESEVYCTLQPNGPRTGILISHSGLPNPQEVHLVRDHWQQRIIQPLRHFFDHDLSFSGY